MALAAALLLLSACGSGGDDGGSSSADTEVAGSATTSADDTDATTPDDATGGEASGTFRFALVGGLQTWDPHPESRAFARGLYNLVYDGLLTSEADGSLSPGLASEWAVAADRIQLTLREDVMFHDGTAFDAEAVKWNIEKGQQIKGVTGSVLAPIETVDVVDPTHVDLVLSEPAPGLIDQLALMPGMMVSPDVSQADLDAGVPAGTGPYMIDAETSSPESGWNFDANPDYWDDSLTPFERFEITLIADPAARLNALLAGQVDAAHIDASQMGQVEDAGLEIADAPTNMTVLQLTDIDGTLVAELGDERVRQAISHAIDRDAFVQTVLGGVGTPVAQLYGEGQLGHIDGYEGFPYDPERAKELLAEAGAENLEFSISSQAFFALGGTALQGMLAEVGIAMNLDTKATGAEMLSAITNAELPGVYTFMPDRHPQSFFDKHLRPGSVYNGFDAALPGVTEAEAAAKAAFPDEEAMQPAYADMLTAVYDSGWVIPIAEQRNMVAFNPDAVSGLTGWTGVALFPHVRSLAPAAD